VTALPRALPSFFCLFLLPAFAWADFAGKVIGVIDGDTIDVLIEKTPVRIRLHGIDCPEKGQAFGKRAKQATSALVFEEEVTVQEYGKDKYGRTIADVILADGVNLNHELVKQGWCWWYRRYEPDDTVLARLEKEARDSRRGLWVDPNSVPPWEWRQRHGEARGNESHGTEELVGRP
jgi:endonuclease YncB( thermonuclease family)